jgi:hypothetical protein
MRNVYTVLVGKPEGKRPLGRPISNIRMDLKVGVWIGFIWLRIGTDGGLL